MSWEYRLSHGAAQQLRRLPRDRQEQIARALDERKENPLREDVLPLKSGKFKGALRKRVGRYRIIFSINALYKIVEVAAILLRSERTYR